MKTIEEIYREMLACYGERTGMKPREGCDLSARLYALAAQVHALQIQIGWLTRQTFPQTAEGRFLDQHAQLRGLTRKQAVKARGQVEFSTVFNVKEDKVIPAGTVCMTAGLVRFQTLTEGVIHSGSRAVKVPVEALEPGAGGNVPPGTVTTMAVAPMGVDYCTNREACTGGVDMESDEALRQRVLDSFRRLPNGANAAFYEQSALSFDQVAGAAVIPRPRGVGTVDVVVATQSGAPDSQLLAELTEYFRTRREIAVDLQVRGPSVKTVAVTVKVKAREGWEFQTVAREVEQAVRSWFTGERLGKSVLRAQLGDLVYGCDGVENYQITAPSTDVAVGRDGLPALGTLKVEAMA